MIFLLESWQRKYKRLKKAQRERENGQGGSDDDEFDGSGGAGRSAEDQIKDNLFDDVDGICSLDPCDILM